MVSLEIIREFMLPYYKWFTDFLRGRGVEIIFVDTDIGASLAFKK